MAQTINTNVMSLTAQRNLNSSQSAMAQSMQRLSSGLRVNSARDDAAGLAIAERMNTQVRGMNVAVRNANDGISLAQVAEGGLSEVSNMMQRMRELAVQSANGTNSATDRANLNAEFQALDDEIVRISEVTKFNGIAVIGAGQAGPPVIPGAGTFTFQVGANEGETLDITTVAVTAVGGDIVDATNASAAITAIDTALDVVTTQRATYGAAQSRFDSSMNNLQLGMEVQAAARGRIMDADFAVETASMTRAQILQQAGNAMVSQANSAPQGVLQLLG